MAVEERVLKDLEATLPPSFDWPRIVAANAFRSSEGDPEEGLVELANWLQEQEVIDRIGRAWLSCIAHGRHPMLPTIDSSGRAIWRCPRDASVARPIGELTPPSVEEPVVEDDHVRWFHEDWGIGAIARSDGDAWVHFSEIRGQSGYKTLAEGDRVTYDLHENVAMPGYAWRALNVRRVDDR